MAMRTLSLLLVTTFLALPTWSAARAQGKEDPTLPEQGISNQRLFTTRVTAEHPLPVAIPPKTNKPGDAEQRRLIAGFLQANTGISAASIFDGHGHLEGDILVGTEGALGVRNVLSSTFGAVVTREQLLELANTRAVRAFHDDLAEGLDIIRDSVVGGLGPEFARLASGEPNARRETFVADVDAFLLDLRATLDRVGIFSTGISSGKIWDKGEIPYVVEVGSDISGKIDKAATLWREATNQMIKLIKRDGHKDYVAFVPGNGCSSYVGKQGGRQEIRLSSTCSEGSVAHEIGHALGLHHEQTHPQRDTYVEIDWSNIKDAAKGNFEISKGARALGEYDYGSIMHYSSTAFAIDTSKPTIKPKQDTQVEIGQRSKISAKDVAGVAALYGFRPPGQ